jgi:hypothetical protein
MTSHEDAEDSTLLETPLCDAQIEKLRSVYDLLLLVLVFQFAKDLERVTQNKLTVY